MIDGYTQPGSKPNSRAVGNDSIHLIELNGNGAGFLGLTITAGKSTVRGLVINRFNGNGPTNAITFRTKGGNTVEGCFLGLNAAGTAAATNRDFGILIENSPANMIGGITPAARNVIAGNNTGIQVNGTTSAGTTIQGNYIGINAAGTAALTSAVVGGQNPSVTGIGVGNNGDGTGASNTVIGGTTASARNVVSGNASRGIFLFDGAMIGTRVQGNYIGTNATGTAAVGSGSGVSLLRTNNTAIGGIAAGSGNLISGNKGHGVDMIGDNNLIQGNLIGTNVSGKAKVGNLGFGIRFEGNNNAIGGTVAGARNIISGSGSHGIRLELGTATTGNVIRGNYIGTNSNGTAALGNFASGIQIFAFSPPSGVNIVGGSTAAARNIISGNGSSGITGGALNALIQGNFIGTDVSGTEPLGNGYCGIESGGVDGTTIGGTAPGEGNLIAYNGNFQFRSGTGYA